jgi:hypothetical protein
MHSPQYYSGTLQVPTYSVCIQLFSNIYTWPDLVAVACLLVSRWLECGVEPNNTTDTQQTNNRAQRETHSDNISYLPSNKIID